MSEFTAAELRARVAAGWASGEEYGDYLLNPLFEAEMKGARYKDAAVLIGLREFGTGTHVILTQRTAHLASHAGQVAFPGGKIDPEDASAEAAALREAQEEIGLDPSHIDVIGRLPDYLTGSGYRIKPVLAQVDPRAEFERNPHEVEAVFEVPLAFLMDTGNHMRESRMWQGIERHYYTMNHSGHRIWGVTAGIIRMMHERLYI